MFLYIYVCVCMYIYLSLCKMCVRIYLHAYVSKIDPESCVNQCCALPSAYVPRFCTHILARQHKSTRQIFPCTTLPRVSCLCVISSLQNSKFDHAFTHFPPHGQQKKDEYTYIYIHTYMHTDIDYMWLWHGQQKNGGTDAVASNTSSGV
jgi:hypothetical protein